MKLSQFAALSAEHYEDDDAHAGASKVIDPAIIALIVQLLPVIIEAISKCMEARAAKKAAANPSLLQMTVLNMSARRAMGGRAFRQHGRAAVQSIVAAA